MSEYIASPRGTSAPFAPVPVALVAATVKTVLQVAIPSTTDIRVLGWGVSFDGVSGTAIPVICQLIETGAIAATVTSLTPDAWGNSQSAASLCAGGAALTGYNASAEGTITVVRHFDAGHVHPQSGYGVWYPQGQHQPRIEPSVFLRIRCTAPAAVNVIPWIIWDEPAM